METVTRTDFIDGDHSHLEAIERVEDVLRTHHDVESIHSTEVSRRGVGDWSVAVTAVIERA